VELVGGVVDVWVGVVVVVVLVTSELVVDDCTVEEEVVVLLLLDDDVDDELDEEDLLGSDEGVLGGVLVCAGKAGADDWAVPSVATCSSPKGGLSGGRGLLTPELNNATTAAPRNAPTATRNEAPRWSSTVYFYWVTPFGSSGTGKLPKVDR
jgi:hypothetical protein